MVKGLPVRVPSFKVDRVRITKGEGEEIIKKNGVAD